MTALLKIWSIDQKKKRLKKMKIIASGEWKSEVGKGEWSGAAVFVF